MASPAFAATAKNFVFGGSPTSISLTEPGGTGSGYGLVMQLLVENDGAAGPGTVSLNTAGTWEALSTVSTGAFDLYTWVNRRGGSAPDYQVNFSNALDGTFQYAELTLMTATGIVATGTIQDVYAYGTPGTGTTVDPPSITPTSIETLILAWGTSWAGFSASGTPSGYTLRQGNDGFDTIVASKALATAVAEDPAAFTATGSDSQVGFTIALRSVAAGGGGSPPARHRLLLGVGY